MGGLGVPSPTSGAMLVFIDRTWGTPRRTNLCVASSKPSTFSRITPLLNRRLPTSRLARAGLVSNTNSGSFGLVACSALTNAGSIVVLLLAGWQVPQVRPLPAKVSVKKMSAPAQICCVASPVTTRGSDAQAARRSAAVSADVCVCVCACVSPATVGDEPSQPTNAATVNDAKTGNPTLVDVMRRSLSRSRIASTVPRAETAPDAGRRAAGGATGHKAHRKSRLSCGPRDHDVDREATRSCAPACRIRVAMGALTGLVRVAVLVPLALAAGCGNSGNGNDPVDRAWADWPMPNDPNDVATGAPNPMAYTVNGDGTVTD